MASCTGSRPLQSRRYLQPGASLEACTGVVLPIAFIKIHSEKEATFIQKHRVNTRDEIPPALVVTGEMRGYHFIEAAAIADEGSRRT